MPERFELAYTGADNAEHRPVMIHRALLGSFERFIGILIEHYAGEFPLWLAPVQAVVLPIADRHLRLRARGGRGAARGGPARRGRRAHRVGRQEDPRRRAAEGARTCWWSGDKERGATARWPCAATARATSGRSPADVARVRSSDRARTSSAAILAANEGHRHHRAATADAPVPSRRLDRTAFDV